MAKSYFRTAVMLLLLIFTSINAQAKERVVVISDSILLETTAYNAYSKTPNFLIQDISDNLRKNKELEVVPYSEVYEKLKKRGVSANYVANLQNVHYGYDLNFKFLKDVSNTLGTKNIIIITSSIERERDFLKNTFWNVANLPSMDVVNPTQRVSVYAALVDTKLETIVWEEIYAKNIRNNKFKNLDASLGGDPEGMMRLKQYSKYIAPEIASNASIAIAPQGHEGQAYVNKFEESVSAINRKMRIGSNKKLRDDNAVIHNTFVMQQKATDKTKEGIQNIKNKIQQLQEENIQPAVYKSSAPLPSAKSENVPTGEIKASSVDNITGEAAPIKLLPML